MIFNYFPILACLQSMWQENIVFISDIDLIKEVLKKPEASARPKPFHEGEWQHLRTWKI